MKANRKRSLIPVFGSQMTATVSVALVLFVLGVVAMLAIGAHRLTIAIKEQVGIVVVLDDKLPEQQINELKRHFSSSAAVADYRYISADEVFTRWKNDMGEDLDLDETLLGINPFSPEFEVNLRADYIRPDSMQAQVDIARGLPGVRDVKMNLETASELSRTVDTAMLVLTAVALSLMVVSFVLINNTIRLSIYSKRFQIHTMKLVGATAGFIRRPFVGRNVVSGVIAAFVASVVLVGVMFYVRHIEPQTAGLVGAIDMAWIIVGMFGGGIAICGLAALFATNRYIRISYDDMFK